MGEKEQRKPKENSIITNIYLTIYNVVMFFGWGYILFLTIKNYVDQKTPKELLPIILLPLKYFQTGAVLEIFHSMFGLVASPVMSTLMQIASRVFLVWFVLDLEKYTNFTVNLIITYLGLPIFGSHNTFNKLVSYRGKFLI
jgi:hypothetical protein